MWAVRARQPLVGRERELAFLEARLEGAERGDGRFVLVAGEAGIGKSRLVAELAAGAGNGPVITLGGNCVDMGEGGPPYGPFVEILREALHRLQLSGAGLAEWAMLELAALVPAAAPPGVGDASEVPDEFARARLLEAIVETLVELSYQASVLLIIEDVHWADRSTRDLLAFLMPRLEAHRVLMIGTYRTDSLARGDATAGWLAELDRRPMVDRLELRAFTRAETEACMAAILGRSPDSLLIDAVHRRTDGNPFAVEELTVAVLDGGPDALPPGLRDSILATLSTLQPAARDVVAAASVIGQAVDDRLLAEVVGLPAPDLLVALRELVDQRILVVGQDGTGYTFRHALTREVAYLDLLPSERRRWHAAAADALEAGRTGPSSAEDLAVVAYHRDAAGDTGLALVASITAAEGAERVYAFADAARWLDRALVLWDAVAPDARPLADHAQLVAHAAEATALAGDATRACGLLREAIAELGDQADSERRGRLWERLADYLWLTDQHGRLEAAQEAVRLLRQVPPSAELARAEWVLGGELFAAGDAAGGAAAMDEAVDVAHQVGATVDEATARLFRAATGLGSGSVDEAIRLGRESVRIATEARRPRELGYCYIDLIPLLSARGRLNEAVTTMEEALEAGRRFGFLGVAGSMIVMNGADALHMLGRWDEERQLLTTYVGGSSVADRWLNIMLAQASIARGALDEGRRLLAETALDAAHNQVDSQARRTHATFDAELALASGEFVRARAIVDAWRDAPTLASFEDIGGAQLLRVGLAAEAELASSARRRGRTAMATVGQRVADLSASLEQAESATPDESRLTWPFLATARAEATRIESPGDPEAWTKAEAMWAELPSPQWVAYCRYRRAEALLGAEHPNRAAAAELIGGAHRIATELGARLLVEDVTALARRARIELPDGVSATSGNAKPAVHAPATPADPHGLTEREREVLALLVAGRTNREIGETLFISPKTAGVHVSNILGKLGAVNRVEAASIAHRLRLLG